jgi:FKBP-type peptidyl-prolyl cis-trans isomerase FkpA
MKNLFLMLFCAAAIAGCKQGTYRKTPGGMPYQVFRSKDTAQVRPGNVMKVMITEKVNDSTLFTNTGGLPLYLPVFGQSQPYDISEVWTKLHLNDSVIATRMMDTFIKRSPMNIPPQFKKGDRILTFVKIVALFANDSTAKLDEEKEKAVFSAKEAQVVEKFLAEKSITAQKTKSGAYVQILDAGTGNQIDSGKYVSVDYTGSTFQGVKFDSNVDTSFHHVEPFAFTVGTGQMIKGFDEGLMLLKPGAKAKIYIPSLLAYGAQSPNPKLIKPYENLVFDIVVKDVKDKAPPPPPQQMNMQPQKVDAPQPNK